MIEKVMKSMSKLDLYKMIRNLEAELQRLESERDDYAKRLREDRSFYEKVLLTQPAQPFAYTIPAREPAAKVF